MHPESVLLPLTYGAASVLSIGCLLLTAIAGVCGVFTVTARSAMARRFTIRPGKAWALLAAWSAVTGWMSSSYQSQYHFAAATLAAHQPAIADNDANAALILTINPTVWAVKTTLLLLIGGFLWVGTTRARAAAALLLAHSQGFPEPAPRPVPASRKSRVVAPSIFEQDAIHHALQERTG